MSTHFHDFLKDDGRPVTVEFSATGGEDNFDHPGHICDGGGSGPEIVIVDAWPNTPEFDDICGRKNKLKWPPRPGSLIRRVCDGVKIHYLELRMWLQQRRSALTDAERERMEEYLAEHHVEEPPDFEDWHR